MRNFAILIYGSSADLSPAYASPQATELPFLQLVDVASNPGKDCPQKNFRAFLAVAQAPFHAGSSVVERDDLCSANPLEGLLPSQDC